MNHKYYYRYFFSFVASLIFVPYIYSLETICKFEVCRNTITGTTQLNLPIGKTEIWVYGKYADLVESFTWNDIQSFSLEDSPVKIEVSDNIINKRGVLALNSCETGIRLVVTGYRPTGSPIKIKMFGNILGVKTQTFEFTLNILPTPGIAFCELQELNGIGVPHSELIEGKPYNLIVYGDNLENIRLRTESALYRNFFIQRTSKKPEILRNGNNPGIVFEVVFKQNIDRSSPIETFYFNSEEKGLTCPDKTLETFGSITKPSFFRVITSSNALTPLPELVDAGLNRKYGEVSAQCSGSNVAKVNTNRTTLDLVRAQIPTPTSSNPVVYQDVTWPNIKWGVKNIGIATSSSFTIQLKDGQTILDSQTLNGLGSGEERLFTYERPKSTKRLFRNINCNPNQDVFVFKKAIRNEADLVMMEPYLWQDPLKFTIVIDVFQNVAETDETNNTKDY